MGPKAKSPAVQRKLERATKAVAEAGPEVMARIFDDAIEKIREDIKSMEILVLRHERFKDSPIPITLFEPEDREQDLVNSLRCLDKTRKRLIYALEIREVFSQMAAEACAEELVTFVLRPRKP